MPDLACNCEFAVNKAKATCVIPDEYVQRTLSAFEPIVPRVMHSHFEKYGIGGDREFKVRQSHRDGHG